VGVTGVQPSSSLPKSFVSAGHWSRVKRALGPIMPFISALSDKT